MRSSSSYVSRNRSFDARKRRLSSALTIYDLRDIARRRTVPRPWWWYDFLTTPKFTSASLTTTGGTVGELLEVAMDLTISFADLKVIRELWPGKIAVKGAQSVADAKELSGLGVDGIVLSNHGGRQLDRAPVRFHLLPAVVREVWRDTEITVDTGIMNGADIVAAIALGAKFTLIGPACLWGLMAGSRAGVDRAIDPHRPDRAHHEAARRARPRRAHPRLRDTTPRPPPHRGGQSG